MTDGWVSIDGDEDDVDLPAFDEADEEGDAFADEAVLARALAALGLTGKQGRRNAV